MRALRSFLRHTGGNTLMMFGLFLVPVTAVIGFSVDGQRAFNNKAQLQNSLDSAVLMAAKEYYADPSLTQSEREDAAREAGNRIFQRNNLEFGLGDTQATVSFQFDEVAGTVDASARSVMKNFFGGVLNRDTTTLGATAQAAIGGNKRLEIALILDNSTSMTGTARRTTRERDRTRSVIAAA